MSVWRCIRKMVEIKIHNADVIEWLKNYSGDKFHAVISDPPYGLAFMGKSWDKYTPIQYQTWCTEWGSELIKHLYPGSVCMFFGGTRTYHRLATGLEDAGFEIFDSMMWVTGQGFPKSHNLIKHGASENWSGFGTALKPAYEKIVVVRKPKDETSNICSQLVVLEKKLCLLYNAIIAENNLKLNQVDLNVVLDIVQWNAEKIINIKENLLEVMDMSQLEMAITTSLNIVQSWLKCWVEVCEQTNTYTTKTKINQTIDQKTLNYCLSQITPEHIIKDVMKQHGLMLNAELAENLLNAVKTNMSAIQTLFVADNATSKVLENFPVETDNQLSIVLCRKPRGKETFVDCALNYGTGSLNVDGSRIQTTEDTRRIKSGYQQNGYVGGDYSTKIYDAFENRDNLGRFPANLGLICDCECEPCECIERELDNQSGVSKSPKTYVRNANGYNQNAYGLGMGESSGKESLNFGDTGGASRFFYTAKSSRKERNLGLDHLPDSYIATMGDGIGKREHNENEPNAYVKNNHPTVKPIKLIEYLATMLKPPIENSSILIPFSGSGSEIIGAMFAGWNIINAIEIDEGYCNIAENRISYWKQFSTYDKGLKGNRG